MKPSLTLLICVVAALILSAHARGGRGGAGYVRGRGHSASHKESPLPRPGIGGRPVRPNPHTVQRQIDGTGLGERRGEPRFGGPRRGDGEGRIAGDVIYRTRGFNQGEVKQLLGRGRRPDSGEKGMTPDSPRHRMRPWGSREGYGPGVFNAHHRHHHDHHRHHHHHEPHNKTETEWQGRGNGTDYLFFLRGKWRQHFGGHNDSDSESSEESEERVNMTDGYRGHGRHHPHFLHHHFHHNQDGRHNRTDSTEETTESKLMFDRDGQRKRFHWDQQHPHDRKYEQSRRGFPDRRPPFRFPGGRDHYGGWNKHPFGGKDREVDTEEATVVATTFSPAQPELVDIEGNNIDTELPNVNIKFDP